MRLLVIILLGALVSCGDQTTQEKKSGTDTVSKTTDPIKARPPIDFPNAAPTPNQLAINKQLDTALQERWHVVTDAEAGWTKDAFDYFIAGRRKTDPDYPYVAKGDFNSDGQPDQAVLVRKDTSDIYRIAILLNGRPVQVWEDDVRGAALALQAKEDIGSIDGKMVKMISEGINVEFYEKSSWILYWDGKRFRKIWTGD